MRLKDTLRAKNIVAVDIGSGAIKILDLTKTGDRYSIQDFDLYPISFKDAKSDRIVDLLRQKFSQHRLLFPTGIRTSLSGRFTLVRNIWVPMMSEEELRASIAYELDQYIPFVPEDVYYDIYIFPEGPLTRRKGQMRVILAVAKLDVIKERIEIFKQTGIKLDLITLDSIALYNTFEYESGEDFRTNTISIVEVGASKTVVNIVSEGILGFSREIELGINQVIQGIARGMGVNEKEALEMLINGDQRIDGWIQDLGSQLGKDIWGSFEFFEGQEHKPVERILLCGGGSMLDALRDNLEKGLGIPVQLWNPVNKLQGNLSEEKQRRIEKIGPLFSVALGTILSK